MPMPINRLLKHNAIIVFAILATIAIAYLSLAKLNIKSVHFSHIDKIEHAIAYFVLTLLWLLSVVKNKRHKILVTILCIFYGIILELLQFKVTSYRTAEYADAIANTTGCILALLVFNKYLEKKQSI